MINVILIKDSTGKENQARERDRNLKRHGEFEELIK